MKAAETSGPGYRTATGRGQQLTKQPISAWGRARRRSVARRMTVVLRTPEPREISSSWKMLSSIRMRMGRDGPAGGAGRKERRRRAGSRCRPGLHLRWPC